MMALYMYQLSYTSESWAAMAKTPQNRLDAVRGMIEGMGGSIVGAWMSFGEYDAVLILEMPDNVSTAAIAMVVAAGGAAKAAQTTVLLSIDEGIAAMEKARGISGYKPPAG